jgi:tripartite-type tricarboxylate transporter receptor subunit TctC
MLFVVKHCCGGGPANVVETGGVYGTAPLAAQSMIIRRVFWRCATMIRKIFGLTLAMIGMVAWTLDSARASTHEFFKGKTVKILIGASAGGAFDTWGRMVGRHLGKQIPGNPVVAVENVTGAGGLILANQLYKTTKSDGLTLATFNGGLLMGQILGRPGIEFDAQKFEYLGVPAKFDSVCAFSKASGITSFDRWKASKAPVKVGGTAPGSNLVDIPKVLMAVFGLPTQIITGYKGFAEIRLAVDGGELAGACGGWDGLKLLWGKQIEAGDILLIMQTRSQPLLDLPKVPLVMDFASNDDDRQLIEVGIQFPALLSLAYALPPATPKDRVQLLRKAFADTLVSPDLLADVQRARLNVDPASGEELQKTVERLFKLTPTIANRLKEILK